MHHCTDDGRAYRILNILNEFTRERLLIRVRCKLDASDVLEDPPKLFLLRSMPCFSRSDNGLKFVAGSVRRWVATVGATTTYISIPVPV